MIWGLGGLVKNIIGGIVDDVKDKRKHKRKIAEAVTSHKIKLATSDQTHNQNWELEQIEGKDVLLRRASFFMLSAPFVVAIFQPEAVRDYFVIALASVPDWYQWAYVSVLGAIWGISEFKKWKS